MRLTTLLADEVAPDATEMDRIEMARKRGNVFIKAPLHEWVISARGAAEVLIRLSFRSAKDGF